MLVHLPAMLCLRFFRFFNGCKRHAGNAFGFQHGRRGNSLGTTDVFSSVFVSMKAWDGLCGVSPGKPSVPKTRSAISLSANFTRLLGCFQRRRRILVFGTTVLAIDVGTGCFRFVARGAWLILISHETAGQFRWVTGRRA